MLRQPLKRLGFILLLSCIMAAPAWAYKPGSVGFLYNQCKAALEQSAGPQQLQQSYCGAFAEGYFAGALTSNWIILPEPRRDDPCYEDKKRENQRINGRACSFMAQKNYKDINPGLMLRTFTETIERWISFHSKNKSGDILQKPVITTLNSLFASGPFCRELDKHTVLERPSTKLSPALTSVGSIKDMPEIRKNFILPVKYTGCVADLEAAGDDPKKFKATRCGAEITGFITGLYSTAHLQKGRAEPSASCKKQIDRVYRSLNITEGMCVTSAAQPLSVARAFIEKYETLDPKEIKKSYGLKIDTPPGAIGYFLSSNRLLCGL